MYISVLYTTHLTKIWKKTKYQSIFSSGTHDGILTKTYDVFNLALAHHARPLSGAQLSLMYLAFVLASISFDKEHFSFYLGKIPFPVILPHTMRISEINSLWKRSRYASFVERVKVLYMDALPLVYSVEDFS